MKTGKFIFHSLLLLIAFILLLFSIWEHSDSIGYLFLVYLFLGISQLTSSVFKLSKIWDGKPEETYISVYWIMLIGYFFLLFLMLTLRPEITITDAALAWYNKVVPFGIFCYYHWLFSQVHQLDNSINHKNI